MRHCESPENDDDNFHQNHTSTPDFARFAIGFDHRDRARFHALIDEVLDSNRWSEADMTAASSRPGRLAQRCRRGRLSSWAGGALAALHFAGVQGETVLCPSNTFMATPLAAIRAGRRASSSSTATARTSACRSPTSRRRRSSTSRKAAFLVHIGGHIAFDSERIAAYCAEHGIFLIEDCAHAHGAGWNGRRPGTYGDAGVYSLYATKTISTGEGGVLVSKPPEVIEHARASATTASRRYEVQGLNFRMSEFTAALGLMQIERLPEIVAWKNEVARDATWTRSIRAACSCPDGMTSGLYKYIVFDWLERSTGRVYDEPCHRIIGHDVELPNSDWVARNHRACRSITARIDARTDA